MRKARPEKKRTFQKCAPPKNETITICRDPEIVNALYSADLIERGKVRGILRVKELYCVITSGAFPNKAFIEFSAVVCIPLSQQISSHPKPTTYGRKVCALNRD
jgi:hypothetical protein